MNDCDVLIVGGGPTGLALAIELDRHGVSSVLVERHATTRQHPRASVVNTRSVELCRAWGVAEQVFAAAMVPAPNLGVTWTTRLAGRELGRIVLLDDLETALAEYASVSPVLPAICPQDRFEPILRARADAAPMADLRFETELVDFVDSGDDVVATVRGANGAERQIRAAWMVAADGSRSGVRDRLGIGLHGSDAVSEQVNIYLRCDLSELVAHRPSVLFYVVNPEVIGFFIALDGRERWLLNVPRAIAGDLERARCAEIVRAALGRSDIDFQIQSVDGWTVTSQVAARYRSGRVLLAGDAAHRFPHTGGFGMNTGLQDAHNLAWKLSAVLRGIAGQQLIDSYESERRPVAASNAELSLRNATALAATGVPFAGPSMDVSQIESDTPDGAQIRDRIAAAIPAQRDHFDFRGQDLGFRYTDSVAVVDDGSEPPPFDVHVYTPSAAPGRRAPHIWVTRRGEQVSTLDLSGPGWVLLGGSEAADWASAATTAAERVGIALDAHLLGRGVDADPAEFREQFGIDDAGAVLVRPDGHVAWRAVGRGDPEDLATAVAQILVL